MTVTRERLLQALYLAASGDETPHVDPEAGSKAVDLAFDDIPMDDLIGWFNEDVLPTFESLIDTPDPAKAIFLAGFAVGRILEQGMSVKFNPEKHLDLENPW